MHFPHIILQYLPQKEELNKVTELKLIKGGKDDGILPPEPPKTDNWLIALPLKTCFWCKPKMVDPELARPFLAEYHVVYKTDKDVKLASNMNGPVEYIIVDSELFSSMMELRANLSARIGLIVDD